MSDQQDAQQSNQFDPRENEQVGSIASRVVKRRRISKTIVFDLSKRPTICLGCKRASHKSDEMKINTGLTDCVTCMQNVIKKLEASKLMESQILLVHLTDRTQKQKRYFSTDVLFNSLMIEKISLGMLHELEFAHTVTVLIRINRQIAIHGFNDELLPMWMEINNKIFINDIYKIGNLSQEQ